MTDSVRFTRRPSFTQVPNALLEDAELSRDARLTYSILASYAWRSDECFPGQPKLAKKLGTTTRTVRRYLDELAAADVISIEPQPGRSNLYLLHPEKRYERTPDTDVRGTPDSHVRPPRTATSAEVDEGKNTKAKQTKTNSDLVDAAIVDAVRLSRDPDRARGILQPLAEVAKTRGVALNTAEIAIECQRYPDRDLVHEARRFADYYSPGGQGENVPIKSLRGRWRTWLSRAATKGARSSNGPRRDADEPSASDLRRLAAEARKAGQ